MPDELSDVHLEEPKRDTEEKEATAQKEEEERE